MKNILAITACIVLLFSSCNREEPVPAKPSEKKLTFEVVSQAPEEITSRAPALEENKIYNLVILVFNPRDAQFSVKTYSTNSGATSIPLTDIVVGEQSAGFVIYVAANVGSNYTTAADLYSNYFAFVGLESDVLNHYLTLRSLREMHFPNQLGSSTSTIINTMPMSGKITLDGTESGQVVIPLRRITAKLNYNVQLNTAPGGVPENFKVLSLRFCNLPSATYFWKRDNGDYPLTDDEYHISDWLDADQGGKSAVGTVYLYENRKGNGADKSITNPALAQPAPKNATYIQLLCSEGGSTQRYYYNVYLGTNNTTNYDLLRNNIYTLTININSINNISSDVRVQGLTTVDSWYKTEGLILNYDGINNAGAYISHVTNDVTKMVSDPALPTHSNSRYSASTPPVTVTNEQTEGARNRWANIATATAGKFNMPLYNFKWDESSGWAADCLVFNGASDTFGSFEYDDPVLFPEQFTIEVVFNSDRGKNTSASGNDLFGIAQNPNGQPYVSAGVEVYPTGFGFIADTPWNGQNYGAAFTEGMKRRVVIQFDGMKLIAWYGNKIVYTEPKWKAGPIAWARAPIGSNGATPATVAPQMTLGKALRHYTGQTFSGRIYAFRFYNRMLSDVELDYNFSIDMKRFGLPKPE